MKKHARESELSFSRDDLRWATPEIVAQYRAERLRCKVIADLGCGIGFQTFAFASVCGKVLAVEKDGRKLENARENAKILGLSNIEFIEGDVLDPKIVKKLKDVEIVFCDPERLSGEEERKVESIMPDIPKLIEAYSKITDQIAIEFPPQIKKIKLNAEREYLSVDGQLNRLTLYFGKLKSCERSAVLLPKGVVLRNSSAKLKETKKILDYIYEVDPAVVKAGLLGELSEESGASCFSQGKFTYFTSKKLVHGNFFKNSYKVLYVTVFSQKNIIEALKRMQIGKVVLRYSVDPLDYWKERKVYESKLTGTKEACLFQFGDKAVIGENLSVNFK